MKKCVVTQPAVGLVHSRETFEFGGYSLTVNVYPIVDIEWQRQRWRTIVRMMAHEGEQNG